MAVLVGCATLAGQQSAAAPGLTANLFPIDTVAYLTGQFHPDTASDFVRLPADISGERTMWLRKAANDSLMAMSAAARKDGLQITAVSATRSFRRQRLIWEGYFTGSRKMNGENLALKYTDPAERCRAILQYSAAPGLSRHHWGTDIDLNSVNRRYWDTAEGLRVLAWLNRHAAEFGYIQAYPEGRTEGYVFEPWHWSYRPLAKPLLTVYLDVIGESEIGAFAGREMVLQLPWRRSFVAGVNERLK